MHRKVGPAMADLDRKNDCLETEFLDEIQDKMSQDFLSLLFADTSTACIEISISSNSRNLLQFLQFSYCTL
jgi:hypothetical protein